jgi:hypothetical protein
LFLSSSSAKKRVKKTIQRKEQTDERLELDKDRYFNNSTYDKLKKYEFLKDGKESFLFALDKPKNNSKVIDKTKKEIFFFC